MNGIDKIKTVHIDEYDIEVKEFLGYDEIQMIITTTLPIENFNERMKNIDMLILHYAAGIDLDVLQNSDPDIYLQSGLMSEVKKVVKNWHEVEAGIEYHTSVSKLLYGITSHWSEIYEKLQDSPQFKEMMKNGNN